MDAPIPPERPGPVTLDDVLESAARLQTVVTDAILVGGSAAALYAGHRVSFDHHHVLPDLAERYEAVLEAVEATEGWATSVRASRPPMTIMGSLGGIEAGLRQLRRSVPLQIEMVELPSGRMLRVPTLEEALRVKAYLVLQRNQVRDYVDVAALGYRMGRAAAGTTLAQLDNFYDDRDPDDESVGTAVAARLSLPEPRDTRTLRDLPAYRGLDARWHDWQAVVRQCQDLADAMLDGSAASAGAPDAAEGPAPGGAA